MGLCSSCRREAGAQAWGTLWLLLAVLHIATPACLPACLRCPTLVPSPPAQVRTHPVLLGECLGGALYIQDFIRLCGQVSKRSSHRRWGWGGAPNAAAERVQQRPCRLPPCRSPPCLLQHSGFARSATAHQPTKHCFPVPFPRLSAGRISGPTHAEQR